MLIFWCRTRRRKCAGNLVATALGVSQVHLSWTAPADNVDVAGYLVERRDPGSTSFVQVGTIPGRATTTRDWPPGAATVTGSGQ